MSADALCEPTAAVSPSVPVRRVAIFAATSWEMQAIVAAGHGVERTRVAGFPAAMFPCAGAWCYVVHTGVGPEWARLAAATVLAEASWDVVISAGFAGGLQAADIGTLLIGTETMAVDSGSSPSRVRIPGGCDPLLVQIACQVACEGAGEYRAGRFLCSNVVVWRAEDKAALAGLFDAVAIDMESAALSGEAARYAVPFLIVRAVSDCVGDSLPTDLNLFVRRTGRMSGWVQGITQILRHPASLMGFIRLGRHSRRAGEKLTRFYAALLPRVVQAGELRKASVA
ncbi:MTA/SAH nucleosidase [Nitrospira sp.]|nr:MTA/SAH nucleosidase [Nitrospira sp.]